MRSIREATPADYAAIQTLCARDLGYSCDPQLVKERLTRLDPAREAVFVAVAEQQVVGFIHVEKYELLYAQAMANILGLAVSGDCRRHGIGRELLSSAEAWAKKQGIPAMRLNSGGTRKGAHAFYRSAGYDDEKEQLRFMKPLC